MGVESSESVIQNEFGQLVFVAGNALCPEEVPPNESSAFPILPGGQK